MGPFCRMDRMFDGRVFRRHAEGVPAHGVQHVETAGSFVARYDIAEGVIAHMAHMDASRRIGKHLQHIVFFPIVIDLDPETVTGFPDLAPLILDRFGVIPCHRCTVRRHRRASRPRP